MRLLLINPNISQSVSDLIEAEARRNAAPGTEVTVLTAPFGVVSIEIGDPGLAGLREVLLAGTPLAGRLPVPVVDGVSSAVRHAETLPCGPRAP